MANTKLSEIFDLFLGQITDYRLLQMSDADIENDLIRYYKSAKAKFYRCVNDLSLNQVDYESYLRGEKVFGEVTLNSELTDYEIEVITYLMLIKHIEPQLFSSENLKQSLSDKDFKIYSQANQLREIRLLLNTVKRDASKMITEYTYIGLGDE